LREVQRDASEVFPATYDAGTSLGTPKVAEIFAYEKFPCNATTQRVSSWLTRLQNTSIRAIMCLL